MTTPVAAKPRGPATSDECLVIPSFNSLLESLSPGDPTVNKIEAVYLLCVCVCVCEVSLRASVVKCMCLCMCVCVCVRVQAHMYACKYIFKLEM